MRWKFVIPVIVSITGIFSVLLWSLYNPSWIENLFRKKVDYIKFSRNIDSTVNQYLLQWDVKDTDVIKFSSREFEDNDTKWLKIYKEIKIPSWLPLNICRKILTYSLHKLDAEVYLNEIKDDIKESKLYLESGYNGKVLYRLILVQLLPKIETNKIKLAIVVDDVGYNKKALKRFFGLRVPLTFAVLPSLKYTKYSIQELPKHRFEVILHLPAEPLNYKGAFGGYVLTTKMDNKEIITRFNNYLNSVGTVAGLNNHMGSVFTENREKMWLILTEAKKRNLFFLDSKTTPKSVGKELATRLKIPFLENNVFIDHQDTPEYIKHQLELMGRIALRNGYAIGICHVQRKYTAEILSQTIPELELQGYEFVTLSNLVTDH